MPHNYTLPSLPLLPPGCHRNQPARSRPASRRSDHPVSFPCSPEPAPRSGLVLFCTLRGTRLQWRSPEQTGSGFATALWVRSAAHHSSQRRRSDPDVCAPGHSRVFASVCHSARLAWPRSKLPRRPPDRGKRGCRQRLGHTSLAISGLQMCMARKRHFSGISKEKGRHEFWPAVAVKWD